MTTEREMLELAAKACSITVHGLADKFVAQHNYGSIGLCIANNRGGDSLWNPLINSGDCAAMCAKLYLDTSWGVADVIVMAPEDAYEAAYADHNNDRESAWRYAATMVGSLIGEYKK